MKIVFLFVIGHMTITGMKLISTYHGVYTIQCNLGQFTLIIDECVNHDNEVALSSLIKRARCILHVL
jgi:hypothetical protein